MISQTFTSIWRHREQPKIKEDQVIHDRVRKALLPILPAAMDIAKRYGLPADYSAGHRPRHFAGNLAEPDAVRLVLLLAEPGSNPGPEELDRAPANWLDDVTCDGLGNGGFRLRYDGAAQSAFEINPRNFIGMIWPEENFPERMKKVVVANAFCMQAHFSTGKIPAAATKEYGPYLKRFVSLFRNAVVVVAGGKASERCRWAGINAMKMGALAPPGSNQLGVRASWESTASAIRRM
jgi:hypothetical protein